MCKVCRHTILHMHKVASAHFEGWVQDCSNSNIFLKPMFRGNFDPFVNNANLGAIAHTSNGTKISIVYRKKCCNLHNPFMVRISTGKNNHLTGYSLALNPRFALHWNILKNLMIQPVCQFTKKMRLSGTSASTKTFLLAYTNCFQWEIISNPWK